METIFNQSNYLAIYNRVVDLQPEAKGVWGKMNVVQMLNHLKIATGCGFKLYNLKDESSFFSRVIAKFIALRMLKQLPKNVAGPEGFNIESGKPLDFYTEKKLALNVLVQAAESINYVYIHPMFGSMSRALWGRLIYRHFDHHLRQFGA